MKGLNLIQHHPVLVGTLQVGLPLEGEGGAATHQHLAFPDRRRRRTEAVHHRSSALCWGDSDQGLASGHRTPPIGIEGWLQLPVIGSRQVVLHQHQGAPLQAATLQTPSQGTAMGQITDQQLRRQAAEHNAEPCRQQQFHQGEAAARALKHHHGAGNGNCAGGHLDRRCSRRCG